VGKSQASRQGLLGRGQRLLPQSHNVQAGVEVAVDHSTTTGADVGAVGEGERLPMATLRAVLTRVRGIHRDILSTGPCCLLRKKVCELAPRRIMNALRETLVVRHPVDREVFNGNHITGVDDATTVLVGEVAPAPDGAFIHTSNDFAPRGAFRRAHFFRGKAPRCLATCLFFLAEEAWSGKQSPAQCSG
jgi:hypothetical protein